jgi:hypothetical protein
MNCRVFIAASEKRLPNQYLTLRSETKAKKCDYVESKRYMEETSTLISVHPVAEFRIWASDHLFHISRSA